MRMSKERRMLIGDHGLMAIKSRVAIEIREMVDIFNEHEEVATTVEEMAHGLRRFIATTPASDIDFNIYEDLFIYERKTQKEIVEMWAEMIATDCDCDDCSNHYFDFEAFFESDEQTDIAMQKLAEKFELFELENTESSPALIGLIAEISVSLYGILNFNELVDVINHYHPHLALVKDDILPALTEHIDFSGEEVGYTIFEGFVVHPYILPDASQIHDDDVAMIDGFRTSQKNYMRYFPEYDDFVLHAGPLKDVMTDEFERYALFFEKNQKKLGITDELLPEYLMGSFQLLKAGVLPEKLIAFFQDEGIHLQTKKLVDGFMHVVTNLYNNTRLFELNGHTPNELEADPSLILEKKMPPNVLQVPFGGERKVGRNEPCPCGSGKKYKKCCLD